MSSRFANHLRRRLRLVCGAVTLMALVAASQPAAADAPERDLKAQILVRALLFVQWPSIVLQPGQALVMCLAEDHPLADAVTRQDGQLINGHRLQVRRGAVDPARQCHVALVGPSDSSAMAQRRLGLLRAGDILGGLKEGVMLNVQVELGRVVFDINLKAAREDGLELDTRLLRLARYVQRD
jgi:hypothetical protein